MTRVVLGCGNFGGIGSKPSLFGQGTSREEAFRLLDAAWELGITTLDTADAYGGGRSESFIGEWLRTKGSDVPRPRRDRRRRRSTRWRRAPTAVSRAAGSAGRSGTSLERLGVDRLPLYMAHAFDPDVAQEETLGAFDELVREGSSAPSARRTSPPSRSPRRSSCPPSKG